MSAKPHFRRTFRHPGLPAAAPPAAAPVDPAAVPSDLPAPAPHVLMVGSTGPSHVYPSLPLIRELVRRGLRVSYAIGGPATALVDSSGAEVVPCTTVLPEVEGTEPSLRDPIAVTHGFLDEAEHVLPQLRVRFDGDRPSVVLFNSAATAGEVVASRWGVPAVELSPTVAQLEIKTDADLAEALDRLYAVPGGRGIIERRAAWAGEEGVGFDVARIMRGPERTLSLIPRIMQPEIERVSRSKAFVGPLFDEIRLSTGAWSPPPGSELPVVLVSFGTIFTGQLDVYRACIEALGDGRHHLVLAVGRDMDPATLGPLPPHVEAHRVVSQLAVLRQAKAFVTHGGMGSVVEALWFGVPMVVIPQAVDQFSNAGLLQQLGVARARRPEEVSVDGLRRDVRHVLQDVGVQLQMTKRAREVRAGSDLAGAADIVERLAWTGIRDGRGG